MEANRPPFVDGVQQDRQPFDPGRYLLQHDPPFVFQRQRGKVVHMNAPQQVSEERIVAYLLRLFIVPDDPEAIFVEKLRSLVGDLPKPECRVLQLLR